MNKKIIKYKVLAVMLKKIISLLIFLMLLSTQKNLLFAAEARVLHTGLDSLSLTIQEKYNKFFPAEEGEQRARNKIEKVWVEFDALEPFDSMHSIKLPSRDYISRYRATSEYPSKILAVDLPLMKRIYAIPGTCERHTINYRIYSNAQDSPFRRLDTLAFL